jgi:hypothetical protein
LRAVAAAARAAPELLPGSLALVVFVFWAADQAGYPQTVWYPGAIFLLALLVVVATSYGGGLAMPRAVRRASAFAAAYVLWSFLSIAWADVKGDAWDGANRTLLYLTVYVLFAGIPWGSRAASMLLAAFSISIAAVGGLVLLKAAHDPSPYFIQGRLSEPAGYPNANAALFLIAFWPAVFLASRRELPSIVRALLLGASVLLLDLGVLTQSRGSLFAIPLVLLLYFALVPDRLRAMLWLLAPTAAIVMSLGRLLDVYSATQNGSGVKAAMADARTAAVVGVILVAVVAAAAAVLDRRSAKRQSVQPRGRWRLAAASFTLALVVATAAGVTGRLDLGRASELSSSHFTSGFGSTRYDVWRVALHQFAGSPIWGVGADNFAVGYLRERREQIEPLYPHSIELRVLSQTGIVGAALFGGFLVCALTGALRRRRSSDRFAAGLRAVCVVAFAYWFLHGSIEWFWEFPGLAAPAFALLALAASVDRPRETREGHSFSRQRRIAASLAFVVGAGLALFSYAGPWLAAREVEVAASSWRADPNDAFVRLERARWLNPLSDQPDLVAGAIADRIGNRARMRLSFARALRRDPKSWYAALELGVVDALAGRKGLALRRLELARALNPSEEAIALAIRGVRSGRPVSPRFLDEIFLNRVKARTTPQLQH